MTLELILNQLNQPDVLNDFCRRIPLCKKALQLVTRKQSPILWAQLQEDLGDALRRCKSGDLEGNYEYSISALKASLEVFTHESHPEEWARLQNSLGLVYLERTEGILAVNIEIAINAFHNALKVRFLVNYPLDWANTQINMGNALSHIVFRGKRDKLTKAIAAYHSALSIYTQNEFPEIYKQIKNRRDTIESEITDQTLENEKRIKIRGVMGVSKNMMVVKPFDLLNAGHFPRYQNCDFLNKSNKNSIVLMVSHRWEATEKPDPTNIQFHGTIRFLIQSCMMAMRSCLNVFNNVDFSEIIISPGLFQHLTELALAQSYFDYVKSGELSKDVDLFNCTRMLYFYLIQTIGEENTLLVGADLSQLAYMIRHFEIWYDYTSLPQKPRMESEQRYFDIEIKNTNYHFSNNYCVILWSASSLKRAWCFLEASLADSASNCSIFSSENSLISSTKPAKIEEYFYTINNVALDFGKKPGSSESDIRKTDLADISNDFNKMLTNQRRTEDEILKRFHRKRESNNYDLSTDLSAILQKTILKVLGELKGQNVSQVLNYLNINGYKCSNISDINFIAERLTEFLSK